MYYDLVTTGFPVAIGTGYALETCFDPVQSVYDDPNRIKPPMADLNEYDGIFINVATLLRNIIDAISTDQKGKDGEVKAPRILENLYSELQYIQDLFVQNSNLQVVYYVNRPKDLAKQHKKAIFRADRTQKQLYRRALVNGILDEVLNSDRFKVYRVRRYTGEIKPKVSGKVLIITHIAYDLLSKDNFSAFHLLESHTGVIRQPASFNRKFHVTEVYKEKQDITEYMPFNVATIQIYGDSAIFMAFNKDAREALFELAKERKWTPLTNTVTMSRDLSRMSDRFLAAIIDHMLSESL